MCSKGAKLNIIRMLQRHLHASPIFRRARYEGRERIVWENKEWVLSKTSSNLFEVDDWNTSRGVHIENYIQVANALDVDAFCQSDNYPACGELSILMHQIFGCQTRKTTYKLM